MNHPRQDEAAYTAKLMNDANRFPQEVRQKIDNAMTRCLFTIMGVRDGSTYNFEQAVRDAQQAVQEFQEQDFRRRNNDATNH